MWDFQMLAVNLRVQLGLTALAAESSIQSAGRRVVPFCGHSSSFTLASLLLPVDCALGLLAEKLEVQLGCGRSRETRLGDLSFASTKTRVQLHLLPPLVVVIKHVSVFISFVRVCRRSVCGFARRVGATP